MNSTGFYIFEFPIITRKNGNRKKAVPKHNEIKYMHKNGCKDWPNCLTCPKEDCDWQPYPKRKKVKRNESK